MPAHGYILALLLAAGATLATWLQPRASMWSSARANSGNLLNIVMGDARRMFADHFFTKADVYFHSGYYPSIFDQGRTNEVHIAEQAGTDVAAGHEGHDHSEPGHQHDASCQHDHAPAAASEPEHVHGAGCQHEPHEHEYLKPPRDWIEAFGRNFFNTKHTELTGAGAHEILPWLRVAAELDPQRVETYTVAAFWLRGEMKRPQDAEAFLRDGQRANPDSAEILLELGQLYRDNYKDVARARNLLALADRKMDAQEKKTGELDLPLKRRILVSLSRLEEAEGNFTAASQHLQKLHDALPPENPGPRHELEKQIAELMQKSRGK